MQNLILNCVDVDVLSRYDLFPIDDAKIEELEEKFKEYLDDYGIPYHHDSGDVDAFVISCSFEDFMLADVEDESLELENKIYAAIAEGDGYAY